MGEIEEIVKRLENIDVAEGIKQVKKRRKIISLAGIGTFAASWAWIAAKLVLNPDTLPNVLSSGEELFPFLKINSSFDFYLTCSLFTSMVGCLPYAIASTLNLASCKIENVWTYLKGAIFQISGEERALLESLKMANVSIDPLFKKEVLTTYNLRRDNSDEAFRVIREISDIIDNHDFKQDVLNSFSHRLAYNFAILFSQIPFLKKFRKKYISSKINLAISDLTSHKPGHAVKRLDKALKRDPSLVGLQFLKGYILDQFGYPSVADSEFTRFFNEFIPKHAEEFRPLRETKQEVGVFDVEYLFKFCVAKRSDDKSLIQQAYVMEILSELFENDKKIAKCFGSFDMHKLTKQLPEKEKERVLNALRRRYYTIFSYVGDSNLAELVDRDLDVEALNLVSELHKRSSANLDNIIGQNENLKVVSTDFIEEFRQKVLERIKDDSLRKRIGANLLPFFASLDGKEKRVLIHKDYMRFNVVLDETGNELSIIDALGGVSFPEEDIARYCMDENSDRETRNILIEHSVNNLGADINRMLSCSVFALSRFVGSNVKYGIKNEFNRSRVLAHSNSLFELAEDFKSELSGKERSRLSYAGEAIHELAA